MKIAFIGTGGVAGRHLAGLVQEPGIEVVGFVSPTPANREAAAAKWGGRAYDTVTALLANETVDAAWICVPPGSHGDYERAFLAHDIPMMIEKPLAADRVTAEQIGEEIERRGALVGVAYHWRALDTMPVVRQRLQQNPARMVVGQWHSSTPGPVWWRHQSTSGGQMVEQATHLVDLARHLLGEATVRSATAAQHERPAFPDADVADVSAALLQFGPDTPGVFSATCVLNKSASVQLQLMCEGLLITITQARVTFDDGTEPQVIEAAADPFVQENRAFLRAIEAHDPALLYSDYADALRTHRLTQDINDASA